MCGCTPAISPFDQYAYTHTTSIKVDAMNVMDMAVEDYKDHKKEIAAVLTEMQKAYEYEKNRQKNDITVTMWQTMIDKQGKLFGGFISFWEQQNIANKKLNIAFIENQKQSIGEAFDQIAQLESKKIKSK